MMTMGWMRNRYVVLQLLLLGSVPLLRSLLSSLSYRKRPSLEQNQIRQTCLYARKNPFRRNDISIPSDSYEKERKLALSRSALFSTRGSVSRNKEIQSNNMRPNEVGAVRTISLVGGLLSVVFTRDVWYAVSSFLIINIVASQSNNLGSRMRAIGSKFDSIFKRTFLEKTVSSMLNFLKAVNEASVLEKVPTTSRNVIRSVRSINEEMGDSSVEVELTPEEDTPPVLYIRSAIEVNSSIPKATEELNTVIEIEKENIEVLPDIKEDNAIAAPSIPMKVIENPNPALGTVQITSNDANFLKNIPVVLPTSASDAIIKATIEVQAAADAASARLKTWLTHQKSFEDEKKKQKLTVVSEKTRATNLPRLKDELIQQMATFVGINFLERNSMALADVSTDGIGGIGVNDAEVDRITVSSGSFSSRAIEASVGTISDFVSVLTSPGKNSLKKRYRQLTKEFHPDSSRNVDLPHSAVNALMSNLTGAFNYISGINSLSSDMHTLMSVKSPWGIKYTGGTNFDTNPEPDSMSDSVHTAVSVRSVAQTADPSSIASTSSSSTNPISSSGEGSSSSSFSSSASVSATQGVSAATSAWNIMASPSSATPVFMSTSATETATAGTTSSFTRTKAESSPSPSASISSTSSSSSSSSSSVSSSVSSSSFSSSPPVKKATASTSTSKSSPSVSPSLIPRVPMTVAACIALSPQRDLEQVKENGGVEGTEKRDQNSERTVGGDGKKRGDVAGGSKDVEVNRAPRTEQTEISGYKGVKSASNVEGGIVSGSISASGIASESEKERGSGSGSEKAIEKAEPVDFTTPYSSKQQILMWKNWGKDIDWGKMKFQGNSEIYSRAQEVLGQGGSKVLKKTKQKILQEELQIEVKVKLEVRGVDVDWKQSKNDDYDDDRDRDRGSRTAPRQKQFNKSSGHSKQRF